MAYLKEREDKERRSERMELCVIVENDKQLKEEPENQKQVLCQSKQQENFKVMCLREMVKTIEKEPLSIKETVQYLTHNLNGLEKKDVLLRTERTTAVVNTLPVNTEVKNNVLSPIQMFNMVESVPEKFVCNIDGFSTSPDGKLYHENIGVMNCVICIDSIISAEKKISYKCSIFIRGVIIEKTIQAKEFVNGSWLQNSIPGFATMCEKGKALQLIYKYLNILINNNTFEKISYLVKKPGWTQMDGKNIYITPNGALTENGEKIVSEYGQIFRISDNALIGNVNEFLELSNLTPSTWVAPLILLYTVMSFSYSLYKEARMTPKFLLFVNGPRGCYKTSLSLLMTQIERTESPEYNLKSTSASIETGYKKYKDAVMLIDDLAPTQEVRERKNMQANLELVVRAFGDSTGKKRNYDFINQDIDVEQYESCGGAVVTGEYVTGCESSLARCLLLPLKQGDVDVQLMTKLQNRENLLSMFFVGYIGYLTKNYAELVAYIREKGKYYRSTYVNQFSNARYGEYYAQLVVAAEVLLKYGCDAGWIDKQEAECKYRYFKECISQAIEYNNRSLVEESPITVLCRAIVTKIAEHMYVTTPKSDNPRRLPPCIFEDETTYYIRAVEIYAMKKAYDNDNGIVGVEYKATALANLLCDMEIAPRFYEGKTMRTGLKIGKYRYVAIDKQKLYAVANV